MRSFFPTFAIYCYLKPLYKAECWFFHPAHTRHAILKKYSVTLSHEKKISFLFLFTILRESAIAAREAVQHSTI
jgi:hypothetical protein